MKVVCAEFIAPVRIARDFVRHTVINLKVSAFIEFTTHAAASPIPLKKGILEFL